VSCPAGAAESFAATLPTLKPHLAEIPLDKLRLWRWAPDESSSGSGGLVPVTGGVGKAREAKAFQGKLERVEATAALRHVVCAVLHEPWEQPAKEGGMRDDGEDDDEGAAGRALVGCNATGFGVSPCPDPPLGWLTLLCPCVGKLPSTDLVLATGIKWTEG
jgi:Pre-mRNA cleavage complex II protein Clp1